MEPRAAQANANWYVVNGPPDVCYTKSGLMFFRVPYTIVARLDTAKNTSAKTFINSDPAFLWNSTVASMGDGASEFGVGSLVKEGVCYPLDRRNKIRFEGWPALYAGAPIAMNAYSQWSPMNTWGFLVQMLLSPPVVRRMNQPPPKTSPAISDAPADDDYVSSDWGPFLSRWLDDQWDTAAGYVGYVDSTVSEAVSEVQRFRHMPLIPNGLREDFLDGRRPSVGVQVAVDLYPGYGGGTWGVNLQATEFDGLVAYTVGPTQEPSYGVSVGANVQWVFAMGKNSWAGPFPTCGFGVGPVVGSYFTSPGSNPDWKGVSAGMGIGPSPFPASFVCSTPTYDPKWTIFPGSH